MSRPVLFVALAIVAGGIVGVVLGVLTRLFILG